MRFFCSVLFLQGDLYAYTKMDICFSYFYNVLTPDTWVNSIDERRYCFLNAVLTMAPNGFWIPAIRNWFLLPIDVPVLLSFLCVCFFVCLEFISPGLLPPKLSLTWVWIPLYKRPLHPVLPPSYTNHAVVQQFSKSGFWYHMPWIRTPGVRLWNLCFIALQMTVVLTQLENHCLH